MFPKLKKVTVLKDYKLFLQYTDGTEGIYDFAKKVGFKGIFGKLKDPSEFGKAKISHDKWKVLTWPGGVDLDPVNLYAKLTGRSVESILEQEELPVQKKRAKLQSTMQID